MNVFVELDKGLNRVEQFMSSRGYETADNDAVFDIWRSIKHTRAKFKTNDKNVAVGLIYLGYLRQGTRITQAEVAYAMNSWIHIVRKYYKQAKQELESIEGQRLREDLQAGLEATAP